MFRTLNIAGGLAAASVAALALALGTTASAAEPATSDTSAPSMKPTVVLVHGAWRRIELPPQSPKSFRRTDTPS